MWICYSGTSTAMATSMTQFIEHIQGKSLRRLTVSTRSRNGARTEQSEPQPVGREEVKRERRGRWWRREWRGRCRRRWWPWASCPGHSARGSRRRSSGCRAWSAWRRRCRRSWSWRLFRCRSSCTRSRRRAPLRCAAPGRTWTLLRRKLSSYGLDGGKFLAGIRINNFSKFGGPKSTK